MSMMLRGANFGQENGGSLDRSGTTGFPIRTCTGLVEPAGRGLPTDLMTACDNWSRPDAWLLGSIVVPARMSDL